jgi:hypothetical protein
MKINWWEGVWKISKKYRKLWKISKKEEKIDILVSRTDKNCDFCLNCDTL